MCFDRLSADRVMWGRFEVNRLSELLDLINVLAINFHLSLYLAPRPFLRAPMRSEKRECQ